MFVRMRVSGLTVDPFTNAPIIILKDLENKKALPIWIGILEASAIATEIEKITFSRPMTHDLMRNILGCVDATVDKVEVNDIKDNVYYATIHMTAAGVTHRIDARPSDAIALALRTESPIYVDTRVLDKSRKIDLSGDAGAGGSGGEKSSKEWLDMLDALSPEDFGKYKM
ncbi:MAG TPA: bifunctional nuclease family protein [Deltaproteobacteria bacterium]|nr:bifunctional nuclease family protein [Deltaproteobacteria bacterium]